MWALLQQSFWPTRANEWLTLFGVAIGYTGAVIAFFWRVAMAPIKEKQAEFTKAIAEMQGKQSLVERFMNSTEREVRLLHEQMGEQRLETKLTREAVQEIQIMLGRIETRLDLVGGIEEVVREVILESRQNRERGGSGPRRRTGDDEPR